MSTVKKLSLSGFKSTFKWKTSRGSSRNNIDNAERATPQQQHTHEYVCENETGPRPTTRTITYIRRDQHQNVATENALDNELENNSILHNSSKNDQKGIESKTSKSGFRQKSSDKTKICDDYGSSVNANDGNGNGNVDTQISVPGSGVNGDSDETKCPPSVNGHILVNSSKVNDNDSGYVGARWSKIPPQFVNCHSFHRVEESPNHQYINDSKAKSKTTSDNNLSVMPSTVDDTGTEAVDSELCQSLGSPIPASHHHHSQGINVNLKCDVNDNAEIFEQRLDECLENHVSPNLNAELTSGEQNVKQVLPPAIPPKPATLFSNGQWVLGHHDSVEACNEKNSPTDDEQVPPRPPARSKMRHGVDTSLPFYKKYLEQKEKSFQPAPIYEDVRVECGLGTGGLAGELSKLPRQPWYWGPMSQDEAEEKLAEMADGSFLVRDSSDERYLLTLSFKSSGRTLHTRIEHRNGLFSLNDSEGHSSVIELIQNAVKESRKGVFGYMNDSTGIQNYPARLTQWVSRYSEVKSLQYLCRFVIRETYPRHHIRHLPLPKKINEYILENQY